MITKKKSSHPGFMRVCFELPACVWADRIYVVGDFNEWNRQQMPMVQDRNGVWRAELELPCGERYEFRYLVDNRWLTDNHSDGLALNIYGTQNSIVQTDLPITPLYPKPGQTPLLAEWAPKQTSLTVMD